MSRMISRRGDSWLPEVGGEWRRRRWLPEREDRSNPAAGLLLAGVVVVGLGYLTWAYLGPDLRRYLKIQSM